MAYVLSDGDSLTANADGVDAIGDLYVWLAYVLPGSVPLAVNADGDELLDSCAVMEHVEGERAD